MDAKLKNVLEVARRDLFLALEPDGGVTDVWHDYFKQSIRMITEVLGDRDKFPMIEDNWGF